MAIRKKTREFWSYALSKNWYPEVRVSPKGKTTGFGISPPLKLEQKGYTTQRFRTIGQAMNYLRRTRT